MFACLSLCRPIYVCLLITRKWDGSLSAGFQIAPGMVLHAKICACLGQKFGEVVMGRGQKISIILFSRDLAGHAP